jgi:hypothetical protein
MDRRARSSLARVLRDATASLLIGSVATPVVAQDATPAPAGYRLALASLESGDTTAAVDRLREVVEEEPDFGPAFFRLGAVLTELDTGHETLYEGRLEAKRMLDRACRDSLPGCSSSAAPLRRPSVSRTGPKAWRPLPKSAGQAFATADPALADPAFMSNT